MGKHSRKSALFMCGVCTKGFGSEQAVRDHAKAAHPKAPSIAIYQRIDRIENTDNEPSFADRAVQAEIDMAMGLHTDDAWLLGE